jgi:hypothetical protein
MGLLPRLFHSCRRHFLRVFSGVLPTACSWKCTVQPVFLSLLPTRLHVLTLMFVYIHNFCLVIEVRVGVAVHKNSISFVSLDILTWRLISLTDVYTIDARLSLKSQPNCEIYGIFQKSNILMIRNRRCSFKLGSRSIAYLSQDYQGILLRVLTWLASASCRNANIAWLSC